METLTTIAIEGFKARLLPIFNETSLDALREFRPWDYPTAAIAAGVGALLASALLYKVGVGLRRLPEKISTPQQRARIEKMREMAQAWLPWLLILSASPVGGVLIMAAGFFALRPIVTALALLGAEILWRASPLL